MDLKIEQWLEDYQRKACEERRKMKDRRSGERRSGEDRRQEQKPFDFPNRRRKPGGEEDST
ncbi:MAG: hypothetical protein ACM3KD_05680 [Hyphomicrobiaceae bacterium]